MRLLLDTHLILWWLKDDAQLTKKAKDLISNPEQIIFFSSVSIWEMSIKQASGKLKVPDNIIDILLIEGFDELSITSQHAAQAGSLPNHHKDPFDRMLIAQAKQEDLTLVTHDSHIQKYDVAHLKI